MFSIFVYVGSYHKVQPVPTNLSKPLWLYDSQKRGETFSYVFIDTTFIKGRMYSSFCLGYQSVIGKYFFFFIFFCFFFFQQNSNFYLSVTSQSFFSWCISGIILKEWILSHFIIQKQFTKQIPTSTVEERIAIPFVNMFIPLFDMIQVSTHIEDMCRLTWISCPYAQMGCKEKVRTSTNFLVKIYFSFREMIFSFNRSNMQIFTVKITRVV